MSALLATVLVSSQSAFGTPPAGYPRSIRLLRVEREGDVEALRFAYEVTERDGRRFFAYARALPCGVLLDLQVSDCDCAGTTGRPVVDVLLAACVRRRLAQARDVTITAFDGFWELTRR